MPPMAPAFRTRPTSVGRFGECSGSPRTPSVSDSALSFKSAPAAGRIRGATRNPRRLPMALANTNVAVRPVLSTAAPEAVSTVPMRAVVHRRYGTPDVLALEEVARPVAGDDEVLVRVHAAGASIGDHHIVSGKPYVIRLSPHAGVLRPRSP